jgi:hypothetical protein
MGGHFLWNYSFSRTSGREAQDKPPLARVKLGVMWNRLVPGRGSVLESMIDPSIETRESLCG